MELPHRDFFKIVQNPELQNGELKVPKSFVNMFWKEMPNPIFLQLPNGAHKWEIYWVKRAGRIWFQNEWEKFAKLLKYGYPLVFKYLGGSNFEVKIFDCSTLEIDYSKIKCAEEDTAKYEKSAMEYVEISDDECEPEVQPLQKKKRKKTNTNSHDETQGASTSRRTKAPKRKNNIDCNVNQEEVTDSQGLNDVVEDNAFKISITSSYPHIPNKFMKRHSRCHGKEVELRLGETSWFVNMSYYENACAGRLYRGWRTFVEECKLEIGDTCLFELIDDEKLVFNVTRLNQ